ncbi:MAG: tetratricopeptide repeat protein [FCB group bacterium]|nr:tetratricopeptide repeat protein [FCB group bacterium]
MSRHLDIVLILLEECDTKGAEMCTMRITRGLKAYIKEQYHTKMGEGLNILTAAASYPRDRQTVDDLLTRVNNVRNYLDVSKHRFISVFTYQLFSILLLIVTFAFASDIELQRARQLKAGGIYLEAAAAYEKHLEANPDDNEARIELVLLLIDINRIPQAEIHVNELKKRDVKDPRLENAYFIVSQYRKSIQEAREKELKQNADDNAKSKVEYARLLAEMGKLDEALSEYNKYLANYPRDDAVRLEMAKRLAWNERYSECGVQISIILSHNPKDADALVLKGDIARWQGDDNTAVEMYKAALNAKPGFKAASKRLDEIYDQPAFREQRSKAAAEQNPGGPALLDLAEFYIEVNRIFEAEDLIRQRLTAYPDDTKAQRLLEIVKAAEKVYYGRRVKELESILVKTPRDYTANLELARLKRDLKDYQEAIRYFDKYVEHYPDDFIVRRERALILKLLKRTPEAVSEYRRLAAVKPDDRELRLELGEALLDDDRYLEEARMLFSSEKENTPDDPRVLLGLADAQRRLGNFPAARVIYENSLAQNPDLERAKEGLRTMETDKGLQIRNLERMLTIDSQDDATRRELVMLLLKVDRDFDAEKQAEILAQKNPDNDYDRDLLAEVKDARRKRLKRELAEVEGELALDPFNRDKRLKYAKLLASDGQKDKALKQYSILYEQNPDNPEVSMRLAEYLATEGDLEKAGRIYSDLVDKDRDNYEYRVRYAQTMSWLGEYEEAEKQYRIALTLDSDGIEAVIGLADTKRWRGEVMAAHDDYRRALEIDPDNEDAKKGLKALYGRGIPSLFITSSLQKDNETFRLSESRAGLNYKWNYNIFGEAGIGTVDLYQANRAQVSNAADNGSFVFGNIQWKYDRNTSIGGGLRNYFMGKRNSLAYSVFFERNLSEATEVNYLLARLEYVSQPAVFEIASTDGLYTWEENLITDRGTIFLNYQDNPKWYLNGRYSFIGITDGNDRNHGILEGGYILKSEITAGLTYETVSSSREVEGYWTPSSGFESVVIWGKIQGEDKQLSYSLRGAIGRVLSTNDPTYQIYGTLDYRASKVVGLSLAGSALVTTRKDGRYQYQAIMGRVSFNI